MLDVVVSYMLQTCWHDGTSLLFNNHRLACFSGIADLPCRQRALSSEMVRLAVLLPRRKILVGEGLDVSVDVVRRCKRHLAGLQTPLYLHSLGYSPLMPSQP
jgi:hypothetical protein